MNKILVHLQVSLGTLQVASVYVPLSRVKRAEDIAIFRPFDIKVLQVRPSSAQDIELKRLDELDRKIQRECARTSVTCSYNRENGFDLTQKINGLLNSMIQHTGITGYHQTDFLIMENFNKLSFQIFIVLLNKR
jgi:hypothetical protein